MEQSLRGQVTENSRPLTKDHHYREGGDDIDRQTDRQTDRYGAVLERPSH
jgi:hypothetical protein